jgi:hypothetical protein
MIVWLCVSVTSAEGTLLVGHSMDYKTGFQVHTTQQVEQGCGYYRLRTECEEVYDHYDQQFRTTYLCGMED